MEKNCGNCKHWMEDGKISDWGKCRLHSEDLGSAAIHSNRDWGVSFLTPGWFYCSDHQERD